MNKYLTTCGKCGSFTSRKYAAKHSGQCKACAEPSAPVRNSPTRNERILEHGYAAYALEEGHYDLPDNA